MTDLPTPNTETGHTPEIVMHPMDRTLARYVELAEQPVDEDEPEFPRAYADWETHYAAVVVYGRDEATADARRDRIIASVNACASIPGDPGEGIRELRLAKDQAYRERNVLARALATIYPSGFRDTDIPGWEPDWHGCVYIDLPTGQISFHVHDSEREQFLDLPGYSRPYDGHTKSDVMDRLAALSALKGEG